MVMVHQASGVTPYGVVIPDPGAPWIVFLFSLLGRPDQHPCLLFGIRYRDHDSTD